MKALTSMPTDAAIREQVALIRKSIPPSSQLGELLHYVIEEHLARRELTGVSIGIGFFGYTVEQLKPEPSGKKDKRPSDVRGAMGRLRDKLEEYYNEGGNADFVHISFPKWQYVPIIRARFDDLSEKSRRLLRRAVEAREKRTASGYTEAIRLLQEILAEHPGHPVILGRLAEIHALRVLHSTVPPRPELELAHQYAQQALSKSPKIWAAHIAVGAFQACLNWNWEKAEEAFLTAVEIGGRHVKTLPWYITLYNAQGRGQELIDFLEDYISELGDPGPLIRRNLATAMMLSGRFDEAIREYESAFPHYKVDPIVKTIFCPQ